MSWIIEDWAGNRLFPDKTFATFEDGWEHIYEAFPGDADDGTYDDLYVVPEGG